MDFDSDDGCLSASSGRDHSRSDLYGEDTDGEDGFRQEYLCPFCAEEFDVVGLCCHVDEEHPVEAKSGVCPICAKRVGVEMVAHLTLQHGSLLKLQRKKRVRKRGSNSAFSAVRKELLGGNLEHLVSSSNTEPDPLLSSFIYNLAKDDDSLREEPLPPLEAILDEETTKVDSSKRNTPQAPLPDEDREESARKCEFVQGLLLSTFLDDDL